MKQIVKAFTEHPDSVGETYLGHLQTAIGFSFHLLIAGTACLIHAVFPFLMQRTASNMVARLQNRMISRSSRERSRIEPN